MLHSLGITGIFLCFERFKGYYYEISINGKVYFSRINTLPQDFNNKKVFASKPETNTPASSSKIRNFKFKTEQDADQGWQVVDGTDCFGHCDREGGKCAWCGSNGYCCSHTKYQWNGDCTESMLIAIRESEYAYNDGHMCVAKPSEEACIDWVIDKDIDFWGNGKTFFALLKNFAFMLLVYYMTYMWNFRFSRNR